jgi:hypothetical protein
MRYYGQLADTGGRGYINVKFGIEDFIEIVLLAILY